jgi:hypothetical protein
MLTQFVVAVARARVCVCVCLSWHRTEVLPRCGCMSASRTQGGGGGVLVGCLPARIGWRDVLTACSTQHGRGTAGARHRLRQSALCACLSSARPMHSAWPPDNGACERRLPCMALGTPVMRHLFMLRRTGAAVCPFYYALPPRRRTCMCDVVVQCVTRHASAPCFVLAVTLSV